MFYCFLVAEKACYYCADYCAYYYTCCIGVVYVVYWCWCHNYWWRAYCWVCYYHWWRRWARNNGVVNDRCMVMWRHWCRCHVVAVVVVTVCVVVSVVHVSIVATRLDVVATTIVVHALLYSVATLIVLWT